MTDENDGVDLDIISGLNKDLMPFCQLQINGKPVAQLSPSQVRAIAAQWMEAAEAATGDAMVARMLTEMFELPLSVVGQAIAALRGFRQEADDAGDEHAVSQVTLE